MHLPSYVYSVIFMCCLMYLLSRVCTVLCILYFIFIIPYVSSAFGIIMSYVCSVICIFCGIYVLHYVSAVWCVGCDMYISVLGVFCFMYLPTYVSSILCIFWPMYVCNFQFHVLLSPMCLLTDVYWSYVCSQSYVYSVLCSPVLPIIAPKCLFLNVICIFSLGTVTSNWSCVNMSVSGWLLAVVLLKSGLYG